MIWVLLASPSDFVKPALRVAVITPPVFAISNLEVTSVPSYAIVNLDWVHIQLIFIIVICDADCLNVFSVGCCAKLFCIQPYLKPIYRLVSLFVFKFSVTLFDASSAYGFAFVSAYLSANSLSSSTSLSPVSNFSLSTTYFSGLNLGSSGGVTRVVKLFVRRSWSLFTTVVLVVPSCLTSL